MIRFRLSPDVLGKVTFAFSPLAELGTSLHLLLKPEQPDHVHGAWLRRVRDDLTDLDTELLYAIAPPDKRVIAPFLFPPAAGKSATIAEQLGDLAALPADRLRQDLVHTWAGRELPTGAHRLIAAGAAGPRILSEALREYWNLALAPHWMRICGVLEDDVSYRSAQAGSGGLFKLLQDLHPEVSLDGHLLNIDKPHYPDACYEGSHMTLVPSVFIWPHLALDHTESAFELTYAARGVAKVWEGLAAETDSKPLGALLGASRLAILGLLAVPLSTTQIAHTLGLSPAAVSRHLSILRDSAMVVSWRSGRSILYRRTGLADTLIGSQRVTERAGTRLPDAPTPGRLRRLGTATHHDAATGTEGGYRR